MNIRAIFCSAVVMASVSLYAETAVEVVTKYKNLPCPPFSTAVLAFDTVEPNGVVTERREVTQFGKILKNNSKNVSFEFTTPKKIKDTRILRVEKIGKTDDNYVYLPELREPRRLAVSERNQNVVGTELTYQDMRICEVEEEKHEMLNENDTTTVGEVVYKAYKIKSTPIKKSEFDYSYRICWYDKETYLPVRVEYYDKRNLSKLNKTFTIEKIDHVKGETGNDYDLRRLCWIKNEITGRRTRIYVKEFKFDVTLPESYFTVNFLRTGKAK